MSSKAKNLKTYVFTSIFVVLLIMLVGVLVSLNESKTNNANDYKIDPISDIQKMYTEEYQYVRELNLEDSGIYFMKMENEPYPFFYITVLDSTVLRENALLPILERLIHKNKLEKKINLNPNNWNDFTESPAEVRFIFNQDFNHVIAEKIFKIKEKQRSEGFLYEDMK
ncbi:MAG: hypothetical protein L3J08_01095 [Flavobacteriaceae bacterium]|nr:hypothetical protein [Flavobacteriaceae bacterium]